MLRKSVPSLGASFWPSAAQLRLLLVLAAGEQKKKKKLIAWRFTRLLQVYWERFLKNRLQLVSCVLFHVGNIQALWKSSVYSCFASLVRFSHKCSQMFSLFMSFRHPKDVSVSTFCWWVCIFFLKFLFFVWRNFVRVPLIAAQHI